MRTLGWRSILGALCGVQLALPALAAEPRATELVPPRWALWTAAGMQWSGSVGTFQPATSPQPGLSLTALLRSPSGAWGFRSQLEVSRYHTSYGDIVGRLPVFTAMQDESDLVWGLAGAQWGATSWPGAPYVYGMAGAASLHTRLVPQSRLVFDYGAATHADATKFAAAAGAGLRCPLGAGHRFELTTEADYRWIPPIDHVVAPLADSTGNHLQWRHASLQMLTLRLGISARWGGD